MDICDTDSDASSTSSNDSQDSMDAPTLELPSQESEEVWVVMCPVPIGDSSNKSYQDSQHGCFLLMPLIEIARERFTS